MDYLNSKKLEDFSSLELSYLGDAIWELEVRKYCLVFGYKINKLNLLVKEYVRATSQAKYYDDLFNSLNDEEKIILKRYKNSNVKTFPKSCTVEEYKKATAFEAYIAKLYISKKYEQIEEIIKSKINKAK